MNLFKRCKVCKYTMEKHLTTCLQWSHAVHGSHWFCKNCTLIDVYDVDSIRLELGVTPRPVTPQMLR